MGPMPETCTNSPSVGNGLTTSHEPMAVRPMGLDIVTRSPNRPGRIQALDHSHQLLHQWVKAEPLVHIFAADVEQFI